MLIGNTPDFQLYTIRNALSTIFKELLQPSTKTPCSRETQQAFSPITHKLVTQNTGACACSSVDVFGPALTLNFNPQGSLHKELSHKVKLLKYLLPHKFPGCTAVRCCTSTTGMCIWLCKSRNFMRLI